MQKLSQKWCVVGLINEVEENYEFDRKDWPLHVTIVPTFAVDLSSHELEDLLQGLFESIQPLKLQVVEELQWSVKVMRFERTSEIQSLQLNTIGLLSKYGAVFNEPQYIGDAYIPHSTVQKTGSLRIGESIELHDFVLVDMFPEGDGARRRFLRKFSVG